VVTAFLLLLAAVPGFDEAFRTGLIALSRNDPASARSSLEAAAKLEPENGRVWVALAQTYWKLHDSERAEVAAGKAGTFSANDGTVLESLIIYYSETGQTTRAAETREHAAALYFEAAQPLLKRQAFADAIGILEAGKAKLGSNAQIELALGVAYYGLRRFDDAAGAFLKTAELAPGIDQPYVFLGKMLEQVPDRLPEITRLFVGYQNAHADNATGYLLHARALDAQSLRSDEAEALVRKSLALQDHDASAHFELGTLLDRKQQFADAAREFERTVSLDPTDAAAHYRLARDYDRLGKHEEARRERERHASMVQSQDPLR
jgi:tetratricopeptide (TPR) repeat protein